MKNSIYRVMVVLAFIFVVNICAQAQIGAIGNRIKSNVQRKVENNVANDVNKAANNVNGNTKEQSNSHATQSDNKTVEKAKSTNNVNAVQKSTEENTTVIKAVSKEEPSAEAKAADPMANDNTVPKGFSKTNAQIRAAYEKLDPSKFIFQPYYKYLNLERKIDPENGLIGLRAYVIDLDKNIEEYYAYAKKTCKLFDQYWSLTDTRKVSAFAIYYKMVDSKGKTGYVPYIDAASNALAVLVMADPDCENALELAINSILLDRTSFFFEGALTMEDPSTGTIDSKKDMYLLDNLGQYERSDAVKDLFKGNADRQARVMEYARARKADVEKYMAAGEYTEASLSMRKLKISVSFLDDEKEYDRFWVYISKVQTDVWQNAHMAVAPAQPMPKTVASPGGSIAAKATAAAKTKWGDKFVKVVYFENTWRTLKNSEYPYNVMGYNMLAGAVLKSSNDYVLQEFSLQKGSTGENIIVGPLGNITKVKYE